MIVDNFVDKLRMCCGYVVELWDNCGVVVGNCE